MNDERYVAAIEISSSKIVAAVGKMHSDGRLDVIASDYERGVDSVRYGIIQNLDETSMRINRVIDRLQLKPAVAPRVITGLYVGMSGRSLRSISTEVEINLPDDTEITDEILERLRQQALSSAIDSSLEVIDAIPRIFTVGMVETPSPKGAVGNRIRATYDLIVCRPELRRKLQRTLPEKINMPICGYVVTALSTAQVILTSDEKRLGCMLVDMGAETTTVSIYKDGYLRYFVTLPLGGRNITRDVTGLSLLEERAEEIKLTAGNAMHRDSVSSTNINGVKMSDVANYIVARSEEIVANIVEQFKYAGFKDTDLPAGIICIGGGSKLNGILDLLSQQADLPVRRGELPEYIRVEDPRAPISDILQVTSVLYSGASGSDTECLELPGTNDLPINGEGNDPEIEETENIQPQKEGKAGIWGKLGDRIAKIFANPEEDDSDLLE